MIKFMCGLTLFLSLTGVVIAFKSNDCTSIVLNMIWAFFSIEMFRLDRAIDKNKGEKYD